MHNVSLEKACSRTIAFAWVLLICSFGCSQPCSGGWSTFVCQVPEPDFSDMQMSDMMVPNSYPCMPSSPPGKAMVGACLPLFNLRWLPGSVLDPMNGSKIRSGNFAELHTLNKMKSKKKLIVLIAGTYQQTNCTICKQQAWALYDALQRDANFQSNILLAFVSDTNANDNDLIASPTLPLTSWSYPTAYDNDKMSTGFTSYIPLNANTYPRLVAVDGCTMKIARLDGKVDQALVSNWLNARLVEVQSCVP